MTPEDEIIERMRSMGATEFEISEHIRFKAEWDKETELQKEKAKVFYDVLPGFQYPRIFLVGNTSYIHHHVVGAHLAKGWVCAGCGAEMTEEEVFGK